MFSLNERGAWYTSTADNNDLKYRNNKLVVIFIFSG